MKLLYLTCHEVLEYDELRLFSEMGHSIVSVGYYLHPEKVRVNASRPPISNLNTDAELTAEFIKLNPTYDRDVQPKFLLTKDFINKFDVVMTGFNFEELKAVVDHTTKPRIIIRSPGQPSDWYESNVSHFSKYGCKVVRFSPVEASYTLHTDAIIRLYVDYNLYSGWAGNEPYVLTFSKSMPSRPYHTNLKNYDAVTSKFNRRLYGFGNEELPFASGPTTVQQQVEKYREARVYFNSGTIPAPYTYSLMEAMSVGTPIVTWGKRVGGCMLNPTCNSFEVPDLITNGVDGFHSDQPHVLLTVITELLQNKELADTISANGRKKCIELFSKDVCRNSWELLFKSI